MLEFLFIICFMNYMHSKSVTNKIKEILKISKNMNV